MIEFKGNVSKKCRRFIKWKMSRVGVYGIVAAMVIVAGPIVVSLAMWRPWTLLMTLPPLTIFPVLCFAMEKIDNFTPLRITISKDGSMKSECKETTVMEQISNVKKVKDLGDFYYVYFGTYDTLTRFVCQKDLLTKGTLEEFEEMFAEKMTPPKKRKK